MSEDNILHNVVKFIAQNAKRKAKNNNSKIKTFLYCLIYIRIYEICNIFVILFSESLVLFILYLLYTKFFKGDFNL